jgi:hypothetical protein
MLSVMAERRIKQSCNPIAMAEFIETLSMNEVGDRMEDGCGPATSEPDFCGGAKPAAARVDISELQGQVLQGDAFDLFDRLPDQSIDLIITSPPYWGHREYGLDHNWKTFNDIQAVKRDFRVQSDGYRHYRDRKGILGLEPYPEWYVSHLVEIFGEGSPLFENVRVHVDQRRRHAFCSVGQHPRERTTGSCGRRTPSPQNAHGGIPAREATSSAPCETGNSDAG